MGADIIAWPSMCGNESDSSVFWVSSTIIKPSENYHKPKKVGGGGSDSSGRNTSTLKQDISQIATCRTSCCAIVQKQNISLDSSRRSMINDKMTKTFIDRRQQRLSYQKWQKTRKIMHSGRTGRAASFSLGSLGQCFITYMSSDSESDYTTAGN